MRLPQFFNQIKDKFFPLSSSIPILTLNYQARLEAEKKESLYRMPSKRASTLGRSNQLESQSNQFRPSHPIRASASSLEPAMNYSWMIPNENQLGDPQ